MEKAAAKTEICKGGGRWHMAMRVAGIIFLCGCAAACSFGSYKLVSYFEERLADDEFHALSKQMEISSQLTAASKLDVLSSISSLIGTACPQRAQWPNCSLNIDDCVRITGPLANTVRYRDITFAPIVLPEEVAAFEEYIFDTYDSQNLTDWGYKPFGRGISGLNTATGEYYHDTTGPTVGTLGNAYQILAPYVQSAIYRINRPFTLFNSYSQANRIGAIDSVIIGFNAGLRGLDAAAITEVINFVMDGNRPAAMLAYPVSAKTDSDTLVGFVYGVMNWDLIFSSVLPSSGNGIVIELSIQDKSFLYHMHNGIATFKSYGGKHKHRENEASFSIFSFQGANQYMVYMYTTDDFTNRFRSNLPIYAVVTTLIIVLSIGVIFALRDYQLRQKALESQLILNTKRLFVRFISHEIRTPMNIVHLGLRVIEKEMQTAAAEFNEVVSKEASKFVKLLQNWTELAADVQLSSDAAISVLNDLINYDKISLGGLTIETEPVDIWSVLRSTVHPFHVQAREKNITLQTSFEIDDDQLPAEKRHQLCNLRTMGDELKLVQVVRNLISNALKFTPVNGVVGVSAIIINGGLSTCGVKFKGFTQTGSILITVKDSGHGMTEEEQKDLFKEGIQFRANQLQAGGGSGLGLWISKGVVQLHMGSLTAESAGDMQGSSFHLELPVGNLETPEAIDISKIELERRDKDMSKQTTCASSGDYNEMKGPVITLLCVDDSAPSRKMTVRMMKNRGYTCYEAYDGVHCLEQYKALTESGVTIDAVLMDYEMPNMNGPDATRELLKLGVECPIIGITGNVLPEERTIFLKSGVVEVLAKPMSVHQLESAFLRHGSHLDSVSGASIEVTDLVLRI